MEAIPIQAPLSENKGKLIKFFGTEVLVMLFQRS